MTPTYATAGACIVQQSFDDSAAGKILVRALAGEPEQHYYLYVPRSACAHARVLVSVHGISRNALEHTRRFAPLAENYGVILVAPLFEEGPFPDYQRLGIKGRRADHALGRILVEVAQLSGASTERFYLFGYSGGGQFAHRYAMAHPERVAGLAVGAAGWYTFPDPLQRFPYGTAANLALPDLRFSPERFLRIPTTVMVGENDVARGAALRQSARVDAQQGTSRRERAARWIAAMREAARARGLDTRYEFVVLPRARHTFRGSVARGEMDRVVFSAFFGAPPHADAAAHDVHLRYAGE